MKPRSRSLFLTLVLAQAAHSVEEYVFRLWEVLAPARFISGLVSSNLPLGFAIANVALIAFALWCYIARVRRDHPGARAWAWFWTVLEAGNGIGHLAFAAQRGAYFPGAATAPLLILTALWLGMTLASDERPRL